MQDSPNSFTIDADAAAAAKASGDYSPEGEKRDGTLAEPTLDEEGKPIVPDEDPEADTTDDEESEEETDEESETDDEPDKDEDVDPDSFEAKMNEWTTEFMEHGELSPETTAAVADHIFQEGVPKEIRDEYINAYVAGMHAIREQTQADAYNLVGGEDHYMAMLQWGVDNLNAAEVEIFDAAVTGGDASQRDSAIKGLHARFQQARGSEPDFEPDLSHDGGTAQGEPIIASRRELAKIQATEEYKRDPAVRAKVMRQLQYSMATGKYSNE
jgi:hypothetical protein